VQASLPWLVSGPGKTALPRCKLHPSDPNCVLALAGTLQAHFGTSNWKEAWMRTDSHNVFEGHLPSVVPLGFVETVVMTRSDWDALGKDVHDLFFKFFLREQLRLEDDVACGSLHAFQRVRSENKGFCFVLPALRGRPRSIPVVLSESNFSVTMTVRSGPWSVSFGHQEEGSSWKGYTVVVDWSGSLSCVFIKREDGKRHVEAQGFCEGMSFETPHVFRLEVRREGVKDIVIRFSREGARAGYGVLEHKESPFKLNWPVTDANNISFSTHLTAVAFRDVVFRKL